MKKWFMLDVPVWDTRLLISIKQSDEEFRKTMNKFYNEGPDSMYDGVKNSYRAVVICDDNNDPLAIRLSVNPKNSSEGKIQLSHELSHAVQFMLDYRGLKRTRDSEEAYAYLTSYLTSEIYKRL